MTVGFVQYSVYDTAHALVLKGLTIEEAIAEIENKLGLLPTNIKERIKEEAMKW